MALNRDARRSTETTVALDVDANADEEQPTVLYEKVQESTKEEIVEQMRKPAIVGTVEAKRSLVSAVIAKYVNLHAKLATVSNHLAQTFAIVFADAQKAKNKKRLNATELADIIYEFGVIFRTYEIQMKFGDTHRRTTRAEDSSLMNIEAFRNVLSALEDATILANREKMSNAKGYIVALSQEEKQRPYLSKGKKPLDPAYHNCLFCSHGYVDEPDWNQSNLSYNIKLKNDFEKKLGDYNDAKKAGREYIGEKGKPINRAPTTPKQKPVVLQCHCSEIVCIGNRQGPCLQCRDKENILRNSMGICDSCDVCVCPCTYTYKVSNG
jgi:hypothetical protein